MGLHGDGEVATCFGEFCSAGGKSRLWSPSIEHSVELARRFRGDVSAPSSGTWYIVNLVALMYACGWGNGSVEWGPSLQTSIMVSCSILRSMLLVAFCPPPPTPPPPPPQARPLPPAAAAAADQNLIKTALPP